MHKVEDCGTTRVVDIKAIYAMLRTARDDTIRLELKFEAYLIEIAMLALLENHEK